MAQPCPEESIHQKLGKDGISQSSKQEATGNFYEAGEIRN